MRPCIYILQSLLPTLTTSRICALHTRRRSRCSTTTCSFLNYASALLNQREVDRAAKVIDEFNKLFSHLDEESSNANVDVTDAKARIETILKQI